MLKKIFVGASLASASLVAQAADMNFVNCDFFSGPYVGATGFYQSNNDKYAINHGIEKDFDYRHLDIYAGHDAWGGGLFAGYGRVMNNNMYFGAEIYGNGTVGKQKLLSIGDDDYIAMKSPYTFGATAKLGYLVSPQAMAYVGLGAENSRFRLTGNVQGRSMDFFETNKWAIVPSVGMNLAIDCNWQIGAKLSYSQYKAIDIRMEDANIGTVNPRRATFGLNVTYHFV